MKWPWTKIEPAETVTDLRKRLEALEEQQRAFKALEIEWEEWYDKFRTLYARISRRVERLQALESSQVAPSAPDPAQTDIQWGPDRQAIQNDVLKRRRSRAVQG